MEYHYKITFYSDWLSTSGLESGGDSDYLPLLDKKGLPFIKGKTLKGLLRDALTAHASYYDINLDLINNCFGVEGKQTGSLTFSNAVMNKELADIFLSPTITPFALLRNITSTKINKNGIATYKSLRTAKVIRPLVLYGTISTSSNTNEFEDLLKIAFKLTRKLGVKRNRGLGRCEFELLSSNTD